ncbi:hypothetical protein ASPWEDRAFT_107421 [Aspergillus wentii DTO 134E9]|uniref:Uncharacterized protein n=1 Tax=Aspergillus wentii DTO 134E9 TaxID=1073089 RepID=A0A1L9RP93_ASPWE|nr:uncharacterized protein ASPWEDRAFT_107421 [Aspergillus wentii DTO 134E9]KAI9923633.1 hypothetical protein MW887_008453 [Aspergillus wentii]OJJ36751.1 hypothetical protein ASPWEDRAFT_107421 [Aspergillus wentii DTO 134E9]
MGWFDGPSSSVVSSSSNTRRRSPSRRSTYSTHHPRGSAPSIFSFGAGGGGSRVGGSHVGGRSSPSVFSTSSSSRRARPRKGFVQRVVRYIKRVLRDIYDYARQHPVKVFILVIVPLVTSGVLQKLLSMVGIRLPKSIFGNMAKPGEAGMKEGLNGIMNIAKMFL